MEIRVILMVIMRFCSCLMEYQNFYNILIELVVEYPLLKYSTTTENDTFKLSGVF